MNLLDWLYKLWRNPTYLCEKCAFFSREYANGAYRNYDIVYIKSGWNKHHTHELKQVKENTLATATKTPQYYWHVHHQVLVEALTEPIQNRIDYVKQTKGDSVATRLHFMRPVLNPPVGAADATAVAKAEKTFKTIAKANNEGNSTNEALQRAYDALVAARKTVVQPTQAQWEALHKKECFHYCPWDGKTLLPYGKTGRR